MKTTRIKWDESMLVRCLARVADYPTPAVKKAPVKAEEPAVNVRLEVPSISGTGISSVVPVVKEDNKFKLELDIPIESISLEKSKVKEALKVEEEVKLELEPEDSYTFKWDKPITIDETETETVDREVPENWDDFMAAIDKAL